MLPIQSFNPAASPSGGAINVGAADAGAKILFYNESNYNLIIDFLNGNQDVLHAWEARWWSLDGDTKEVDWTIDSVITAVNTPPISKVMGTLYGATEQLPGTYPIQLVRQTNIGNTVNTVGGTASSVQNDGNASGTNVVEATVLGDSASAVDLTNSGFFSLGTAAHPAQVQFVCALGTITIDANGKVTIPDSINANLITALANNDIGLHVGSTNKVAVTVNGVDVLHIGSTGLVILNSVGVQFGNTGQSMTNWAWGNASTGAGGNVVITHGLGVIPSAIILTELNHVNDIMSVTTVTTTQFTANVSVAAVRGFSWLALA